MITTVYLPHIQSHHHLFIPSVKTLSKNKYGVGTELGNEACKEEIYRDGG